MDARICNFSGVVDAYHDGELSPAERERFERHLGQCAACAEELASLRAISRRLAEAPLPAMPPGLLERLRREAPARSGRRREDRAVLRIAEVLTAAAAAVLIAGTFGLLRPSSQPAPPTARGPVAEWEQAAVTLQLDDPAAAADSRQDPTQLVAWMSEDFEP